MKNGTPKPKTILMTKGSGMSQANVPQQVMCYSVPTFKLSEECPPYTIQNSKNQVHSFQAIFLQKCNPNITNTQPF
jgi:hypothetical protein